MHVGAETRSELGSGCEQLSGMGGGFASWWDLALTVGTVNLPTWLGFLVTGQTDKALLRKTAAEYGQARISADTRERSTVRPGDGGGCFSLRASRCPIWAELCVPLGLTDSEVEHWW